jgi:transcription elongation factor GreA
MTKTYYLTKKGLRKIEDENAHLQDLYRQEILKEAPSLLEGDVINPDYSFFQENLEELEKRIEELNFILKNYIIIKRPPKEEQNIINLGARVIFKNGSLKEEEYRIVGTLEADPFSGKISNESPLGMTFIGKKIGDKVPFNDSGSYKILKIDYEEV